MNCRYAFQWGEYDVESPLLLLNRQPSPSFLSLMQLEAWASCFSAHRVVLPEVRRKCSDNE